MVRKQKIILKGEVNNTASNKTKKWHKYMPDGLISKFTTTNETVRINYYDFDQYWRTKEAGC